MARSSTSFRKGQSGNPGGRPKVVAEVRELAREHTEAAINVLVSIASNEDKPAAARVAAATELLNRGYGRAPQSVEVTGTLERYIVDFVTGLDDADDEMAKTH